MEACATSHHWSRELQALGHPVRLMPPADVKPSVKRQKNDATDAEAICEAVTRANMRFVATKTPEQQSGLVLHRTRHLFIRQQTAVINAIRAHLAASIQRDEQAARCDPGRWSCAGHGAGCQHCRSESVSVRARLRGLDWTGAEAAFEWRQGQARQHQQAR